MIDRLVPSQSVLFVVDVQERLLPAMPTGEQLVRNVKILIETATRFEIPIIVSQQYPKGLGVTVPEVEAALAVARDVHRFDKIDFSAATKNQLAVFEAPLANRKQVLVAGMETHVCVYQTVRDLLRFHTANVHVIADAVASRTKQNWRIGLELMRESKAHITSTEVCVFDLLERAGTENFKALSKVIK